MISVYQVFKLILGVIISIFVLFFLTNYAGLYSGFQMEATKVQAVKNFRELSQDVYFSGNPAGFTDFKKAGFEHMYIELSDPEQRGMLTSDVSRLQFPVPTFLAPSEELCIGRGTMDLGWWKYHYIIAVPETRIVFNPVSGTSRDYGLIRNITGLFPSTSNINPKITFALCDEGDIQYSGLCGTCEKYEFSNVMRSITSGAAMECNSIDLRGNDTLVTLRSRGDCRQPDKGLCIETPDADGTGIAYVQGDPLSYHYHDPLDLVALIVGSMSEESIFGKPWETLWIYKNTEFAYRIGTASRLQSNMVDKVWGSSGTCRTDYTNFQKSLDALNNELASSPNYYRNTDDSARVSSYLSDAATHYDRLVYAGCEYLT